MSTTEKTHAKAWWILFPMQGILLKDARHDLHRPMFGDATILSPDHVHQVIRALKRNSDIPVSREALGQAFHLLTRTHKPQSADAFIAVRCWSSMEDKEHAESQLRKARERAYEVSAALSLLWLAVGYHGSTCALTEMLYVPAHKLSMFRLDDAKYEEQSWADIPPFHTHNWPTTRRELRSVFFQTFYRGFSQALLPAKRTLPDELHNVVKEAALRLYEAIHAPTPDTMILGAVTTTEVLLSENSTDFKQHPRRVELLVGDEASTAFDSEAVFTARHKYVHEAKHSDWEVAKKAVALSLSCLLRYAEAAYQFPHKHALVSYLDFLQKAGATSVYWSDKEALAFQKLRRHKVASYKFLWMPSASKTDAGNANDDMNNTYESGPEGEDA